MSSAGDYLYENVNMADLFKHRFHFGHKVGSWHPGMASYIYGERDGVHIINLEHTLRSMKNAMSFIKSLVAQGGNIMIVATKEAARDKAREVASKLGQYHVTHTWLGGMLTNWSTVCKSIKKYKHVCFLKSESYKGLTRPEMLRLERVREKLWARFEGIEEMRKLPSVLFVVDVVREGLAVKEARAMGIPIVGLVDTNSDPSLVDYPIFGNDDSEASVTFCLDVLGSAISKGLAESASNYKKGPVNVVRQRSPRGVSGAGLNGLLCYLEKAIDDEASIKKLSEEHSLNFDWARDKVASFAVSAGVQVANYLDQKGALPDDLRDVLGAG